MHNSHIILTQGGMSVALTGSKAVYGGGPAIDGNCLYSKWRSQLHGVKKIGFRLKAGKKRKFYETLRKLDKIMAW